MKRVTEYIQAWQTRGYSDDIPDEVPGELMRLRLAPSYKAIAIAILQNDLQFLSLGFAPKDSAWYSELKRLEIEARPQSGPTQHRLFS
jgi:predicted phosphoadenosine phosphosulfate sulfurtransferase